MDPHSLSFTMPTASRGSVGSEAEKVLGVSEREEIQKGLEQVCKIVTLTSDATSIPDTTCTAWPHPGASMSMHAATSAFTQYGITLATS